MKDPKDAFNKLIGMGGPALQDSLNLIKDPNTPVRDKVKLTSGLLLPQLRSIKNQPTVAMMLPMVVATVSAQVKDQFQQLPKEFLVAQIDAELAGWPSKEELKGMLKSELVATAREKTAASKAPAQKEAKAVVSYLEEVFDEIGEEQYVALATGLAGLLPEKTRDFLTNPERDPQFDAEAEARKGYARFQAQKGQGKAESNDAFEKLLMSDEGLEAAMEVLDKLSGEKVYGMAEKIVNELDDRVLVAIVENALAMAEDVLVAGKESGNPLRVKDGTASAAFAKAVGQVTQLVEDAVVEADILPDTDLRPTYAKILNEVKQARMQPAPKGPKPQ